MHAKQMQLCDDYTSMSPLVPLPGSMQANKGIMSKSGPITFLNMDLGDSDSDDSSFG